MTKFSREDVTRELSWPTNPKRTSQALADDALRPADTILRAFGWSPVPWQDGWKRWIVGRGCETALMEAREDVHLVWLRAPGWNRGFTSNRLELITAAIKLADVGFGTMPSAEALIGMLIWVQADAAGLMGNREFEVACLQALCRAAMEVEVRP